MNTSLDVLTQALLRLAGQLVGQPDGTAQGSLPDAHPLPFTNTTVGDFVRGVQLWNASGRPLLAAQPARACPCCAETSKRSLFDSYDGYPFVECLVCGCWYVPLSVDLQLFDRFFAACPAAVDVARSVFLTHSSADKADIDTDRLGGNLDALRPLLTAAEPLRYLDIGCGLGTSLRAATARGMQASGVEPAREHRQFARTAGLPVVESVAELPQQAYHLISFWEVLEHLPQPLDALTDAQRRLLPGGFIAFTVPNLNSPLVRVQRADCAFVNGGFDTPGHINLFGESQLSRLLHRAGLQLVAMEGQYGLNVADLLGYLHGRHRATHDHVHGRAASVGLNAVARATVNALGPTLTLLERITLSSPILFGVACRSEEARGLAGRIAAFRRERQSAMRAEIARLENLPKSLPPAPATAPDARDVQLVLLAAEAEIDRLNKALDDRSWRRRLQFFFGRGKPLGS